MMSITYEHYLAGELLTTLNGSRLLVQGKTAANKWRDND